MKTTISKQLICIFIMQVSASAIAQQNNALWSAVGHDAMKTNRFVTINDSVRIAGLIKSDSLSVLGGAHILGLLHVGPSSLTIGTQTWAGYDEITSDNGIINLGGSANFSDIKVGIGLTTPNNTIQVLDLINFDDANNSTYLGQQADRNNLVIVLKNYS